MYAKFGLRPDVDWDKLKAQFRPAAEAAKTSWDAAVAIASLVTPLRDLHVHVSVGEDGVPAYFRSRTYNGNWQATQALLGGKVEDTGQDLVWARTKDDIGYVAVQALTDRRVVAAFDQALEQLATTWALVVDLRGNGGGGEDLALEMAGRIVDKERVYALDQFRQEGSKDRLALGPKLERRVAPRGPWRYAAPVVVLIGQKTMSSAESFAEMLAVCPDVTSVGDRTCGSSGRPQRIDLPGGIAVNVPTWNDMTPEGAPIEDVGVQPEVPVKAAPDAFDAKDPVTEAALALLRKTPSSQRHPGRPKK
jgi:C-terminal processing protease CtpA/Prc